MPSSACDWSSDVCSSDRSEEHTSELQSRSDLVCRLLLEKKKKTMEHHTKNEAVATAHEALENQNEPQLEDEKHHNDKSIHEPLDPSYHAVVQRDAAPRQL